MRRNSFQKAEYASRDNPWLSAPASSTNRTLMGTSTIAGSMKTAIMSCRIQARRSVMTVELSSLGGVGERGEWRGDGRSGDEMAGFVGCESSTPSASNWNNRFVRLPVCVKCIINDGFF